MFPFSKRKKTLEPKNFKEAIIQESSRHLKVKKWTDGVKAGAIAIMMMVSVGYTLSDTASEKIGPHIAVISLTGPIETGNRETDGWKVSQVITDAIEDDNVKAILIEANSPGGSPSDAEMIYKTIIKYRFSEKNTKPIYTTVRTSCASACYYIASATDEIYAMDSSLVGSIGVRMDGWGFQDVIKKIGVERRVFHAGTHKALMDPFKPVTEEERSFIQDSILTKLHEQFINAVKKGRGERLVDNPEIYTGLIWTGEEAVELGLIDGIKTPMEIEAYLEKQLGVDKYIYHGRQKFKLTNLFSMDAQTLVDMVSESIYHEFKSDVKTESLTPSFK